MKRLICILLFITIYSCHNTIKQDIIITEKDLIPEGVAFNKRTGITYIGSTYKRKIIQIDTTGKNEDFIPEEFEGIWSVLGMEVDEKNNLLWVNTAHANQVMPLKKPTSNKDWMTNISVFDIDKRKLIKKYPLLEKQAFFNDLTILNDGRIYVTESVHNRIYTTSFKKDSVSLFVEFKNFTFPNGITYDQTSNMLFISSNQGIIKMDPDTKSYMLLKTKGDIDVKVIDGLTFYKNSLIGHQSTKVSRFYLNDEHTEVINVKTLNSGKEFDSSTTGELGNGGDYHFIVNSQIRSGVYKDKKALKPMDSLENIIIRKIELQ
ncbi:hypothetical protein [Aquimarina longa]|uniref:hypothetical protein n=1 Tax=Aquimarina longa TaxID=1080221 RepID=UPI0007845968|nr:hypothetical protein [Aquimarina longa]